MSRFNTTNINENKIVNRAGGEAFKESDKLALVSLLLTSFIKDQYYRSGNNAMKDLISLSEKIEDKKFVAKAAIYARNQFGMRTVSHIVAAELANKVKHTNWMRPFFTKVVHRADDITEILAYYMSKYGKPIPNSMHFGLRKAFNQFDDYQVQKYRAQDKEVKLIDVLNLLRPVPTEKNKKSFEQLIGDTLKAQKTWNANLSNVGRKAEATDEEKEEMKKDVWVELIVNRRMPYFALLRNLRNIVEQAPEIVGEACGMLTDEKLIKNSLVLPFRFMTAIKQLQTDGINSPAIYKALTQALEISFANVPVFDGKTLIAIDHSGSMDSIEHGNLSNFEIGALFGIALAKKNNADILYFGDTAKYAAINPMDSTVTLVQWLNSLNEGYGNTGVGHGTNFHAVFQEANKAYDRIIFFSDMQGWVNYNAPTSAFESYKNRVGANPKIFSFDLAGYGDLQFPEENIYCLAGFSDKVFDLMKLLEQDRRAMLSAIEAIEL